MEARNYHTKQREAVLACIASMDCVHVTAAQIQSCLKENNIPMGRTTVFRQLDKLTAEGVIRRYTIDGIQGSCYQLIGDKADCHAHLHLKCEVCGDLQHLECDILGEIQRHVSDKHLFEMNPLKTVLYGTCTNCQGRV